MTSKKYTLLAAAGCLLATTGFSQVTDSTGAEQATPTEPTEQVAPSSSASGVSASNPYTALHPVYGDVSVTDSSYYNRKQTSRHNEFMVGNADHPAKPRDMWEFGIKGGSLIVNGDMTPDWNPMRSHGFGAHIRKSLGHTLSLRLEYLYGNSEGQAWRPVKDAFDGDRGTAPRGNWYQNHRTNTQDLSLQLLANVGNIRFYKNQTGATFYVLAGGGVTGWKARFVNNLTPSSGIDPNNRKEVLLDLREQYKDIETADMQKHNVGYRSGSGSVIQSLVGGYARLSATVGGGIAFRLSPRVNLAIEDRIIMNGSDFLDASVPDLTVNQDKDFYNYATIGLNFNLGNKSKRVEPLYWLNPLNYAYSELRRVPEFILPDADGDGVTDQFDQEQTPAGCPVDTHGVSRDTDGDGVPDCKDKELITPTYCQPVDADGVGKCPCPEGCAPAAGDCAATLGALPSIRFQANSNNLSDDAASTLSTVASKLKANPNCKVVVVGYCAATKRQQQLSWDHVNKVISHLVEKEGVGSDRFIFSSGQEGGDCDVVDIRAAAPGEDGPNTVAPPHPNLRKN